MAAVLGKTEISVKAVGSSTTIPNNDIAKLMYYFHCVCCCVEPDADATIRRLRDYKNNYSRLSRDEEAQLLAICLTLSPDKLIGTILFPSDNCGDSTNEFLELSAVSTKLVVAESLVIGGQSKKIQKVMLFQKSWMEKFYIDPLGAVIRSRRPPPPRRQQSDDSCVIL